MVGQYLRIVHSMKSKTLYVKNLDRFIHMFQSLQYILKFNSGFCLTKFLKAIKRFISLKGAKKVITPDNSSYFRNTDVKTFAANSGIMWKFNTQSASWFGRFFECLIRSVKRSLNKELGNSNIDYEQILTVLKQVENYINNKRLTQGYTNSDMIEPVTPNELLYGRNTT